jgi:hypothetical protein
MYKTDLTKYFLKVINSIIKKVFLKRAPEISLDKFEKIWSMKRRGGDTVRGEEVDGT